jgi:hypothetical protein
MEFSLLNFSFFSFLNDPLVTFHLDLRARGSVTHHTPYRSRGSVGDRPYRVCFIVVFDIYVTRMLL